ncbi:MAG: FAD-binding oxidoreductase [Candidatus Eremiobacteraeota bacterium]|nr:FAD-binding oxidoreductase [Candidatus Eremiobacteraeota bacterium]
MGEVSGAEFPGATVKPGDPRYEALSTGFNQRWVGRPDAIQLCGDSEQVRAAVQRALDQNRRVTVRGGGHCYEGFVTDPPYGVIVDLSPMHEVYRDEAMGGAYCVEGGCTLWNVYTALYKEYGVTIPGGSCYSVGAGGHICGGGYGLLSRKHGLTVDHLVAVEVVCVDANRKASLVRARRDDEDGAKSELLWAHTGGGGGNFGIVTRYWFSPQLPRAPKTAYLSSVAWNWAGFTQAQFTRLLQNYGEFFAQHSAPGDRYEDLFALLHLSTFANGQIALTTQYVGEDVSLLDKFLAAVQEGVGAPGPQVFAVPHRGVIVHDGPYRRMPWIEATQTLNGSGANQRGKYKSAYMTKPFPGDQIGAIWSVLSDQCYKNAQALLQVDSYGGAVNAVPPGATAVAQRSSILKLQYQTYWTSPEDDDVNLSWIRNFYRSVYASTGGVPVADGPVTDGCFVNYCDSDLVDWPTLYYKQNYKKLVAVKNAWDPLNVFYHEQSIGSA